MNELTSYEHRILDRLLKGYQLIDAHEKIKEGFVFLCLFREGPINRWELVPRATLDRFKELKLLVQLDLRWHHWLQADITPYIYGEPK